jgi:outer membrane protein insertion porin family/translocation and assembly module TamA
MRRFVLALVLALLPAAARAQELACDAGDLEIHSVGFHGNTHFSNTELGNAIVTTPSSWLRRVLHVPIGQRRCLDTLELARDAVRLRLYYRQRGYYQTAVTTQVDTILAVAADVTFQIREGPPVLIDTLSVTGLDSLEPRLEERVARPLERFRGRVYDKVRLQAAIDSAVDRLQNSGYAYATDPLLDISVDNATNRARVKLTFIPGRLAHIGRIEFDLEAHDSGQAPAIDSGTVRKLLAFEPGDLYRQRDLLRSQRDLYGLETYRHVDVQLAPDSLQPSDTSLTVLTRVGEANMKSMRVGIGWANLDCTRTQARFTDRDFLGSARRLELVGRLSHIALCPGDVHQDTAFSKAVNYYASATLRFPALFGLRNVPSLTLFSERTSEFRTYLRYTPIGGAVQVTRDLQPRDLRSGLPLTLAYSIEYGRTKADPAVFCQIFNRCTQSDIDRLQRNSSLQVASVALARDRTNDVLNPSRGSQTRLELRSGWTSVDNSGSTHFNRALGEVSRYERLGSRNSVLAMRLQLGAVFEGWSLHGATSFVPPQERLYAGGPNSVRGYSQNLLGPVVYIVDTAAMRNVPVTQGSADSVERLVASDAATIRQYSPTGGNTLVVGNLEWRTRAPFLSDVLQLATFVDAGLVWNRPKESVTWGDIRVTPGVGIRVNSPVGPFRVDVAYNRYQSPAGSAYIVDRETHNLVCVSQRPADETGCPASFTPAQSNALFSRLTFNFSIGQAF